jgi:hypothetical protein
LKFLNNQKDYNIHKRSQILKKNSGSFSFLHSFLILSFFSHFLIFSFSHFLFSFKHRIHSGEIHELATELNATREGINRLSATVRSSPRERDPNGVQIITEEEFHNIQKLKTMRTSYLEKRATFDIKKSQVDELQKVVEEERQQLLQSFEQWFEQPEKDLFDEPTTWRGSGDGDVDTGADAESDLLDYQEKFERMQLRAAIDGNPQSKAYYSALKNSKKVIFFSRQNLSIFSTHLFPYLTEQHRFRAFSTGHEVSFSSNTQQTRSNANVVI